MATARNPNRSLVSLLGLAAVALLIGIPIAVAILAAIANSSREGRTIPLVENAIVWFTHFVGLLVTILGLIALFATILTGTEQRVQSIACWTVVVLLGMLMAVQHWSFALAIGMIVVALVLASHPRWRGELDEPPSAEN